MRLAAIAFGLAAVMTVPREHAQSRFPAPPPRPVYADSLPNVMRLPIPLTVAEAEAEGSTWPRRLEPSTQPVAEREPFASPKRAECVKGYGLGLGPVRSGDFVIGGNIESPAGLRKVWWTPSHPSVAFSLVVRVRRIDSPPDSARLSMSDWAVSIPSGGFFYATGFNWPTFGHLMVIATSGPDWGCFLL